MKLSIWSIVLPWVFNVTFFAVWMLKKMQKVCMLDSLCIRGSLGNPSWWFHPFPSAIASKYMHFLFVPQTSVQLNYAFCGPYLIYFHSVIYPVFCLGFRKVRLVLSKSGIKRVRKSQWKWIWILTSDAPFPWLRCLVCLVLWARTTVSYCLNLFHVICY